MTWLKLFNFGVKTCQWQIAQHWLIHSSHFDFVQVVDSLNQALILKCVMFSEGRHYHCVFQQTSHNQLLTMLHSLHNCFWVNSWFIQACNVQLSWSSWHHHLLTCAWPVTLKSSLQYTAQKLSLVVMMSLTKPQNEHYLDWFINTETCLEVVACHECTLKCSEHEPSTCCDDQGNAVPLNEYFQSH